MNANDLSQNINRAFLLILIFGTIFSLFFSYIVTKKIMKLLRLLDENQQQILIAQSKHAMLGELLGGIAHEINNPLAAIAADSEMLEILLKDNPINIEKAQAKAKNINKTTFRAADTLKSMMALVRNDANMPKSYFRLKDILHIVKNLTSIYVYKYKVDLRLPDKISDVELYCCETQYIQVIVNLIKNSCEAITELTEKWITLEFEEDEKFSIVKIIDSGTGIPEEVRKKLFKETYTSKKFGKGTGIGLTITSKIIISHGGKIFVDGNHPHTCFVIKIPKGDTEVINDDNKQKAA